MPATVNQTVSSASRRRKKDRSSIIAGVVFAVVINSLLISVAWIARSSARPPPPDTMTFVDAQLVRFGKPRDLSFLPHVQAVPKLSTPKKTLKLTDDPDKPHLPKPPKEEDQNEPDKPISKLAEQFKKLQDDDDRATQASLEEGDPTGSRGGTATEASGDPYIREVMAAVTEAWSVPNLLTPGELSKLQAAACLKIDDEGHLVEFKIIEKSGNDLFDGSLNTTLGSLKSLPKPHGKFAGAARRGKLCPVFTKQ